MPTLKDEIRDTLKNLVCHDYMTLDKDSEEFLIDKTTDKLFRLINNNKKLKKLAQQKEKKIATKPL